MVKAMLHTCGKVCINMGVAITLTSVTTCHTFKIEVHHRFPLALWVALCLAVASDSKFFHITPKFYVYLTTAPGGKKRNIVLSRKPIVTMVARLTSSTTKIRKESEKNEHIFHYLYGILAQIHIAGCPSYQVIDTHSVKHA